MQDIAAFQIRYIFLLKFWKWFKLSKLSGFSGGFPNGELTVYINCLHVLVRTEINKKRYCFSELLQFYLPIFKKFHPTEISSFAAVDPFW